jgi:plastocyanin
MKRENCAFWLVVFVVSVTTAAEPPAKPAGAIRGEVKTPLQTALSDTVIYLEPGENQPTTAPSEIVKVSQKGAQFAPGLVIVCVGQTVNFLNDEDRQVDHNVFSNSPTKQFDLGVYKPGESRSVTFDKPGPVFLYCSIHRFMDGVIYVAPTPYFSKVDSVGKFEIKNVPAGHWILLTWQRVRRFPEDKIDLQVMDGQTIVQNLPLQRK